jgi:hypothetical protein
MLRFMAPYLIPAMALAMLAGGLYGDGVIGVPATYGLGILACLIAGVGYLRWDFHKYPDDRK